MKRKAVSTLALIAALAGCQNYKQANDTFEKRNAQADQLVAAKPVTAQLGGVIHGKDPIIGALEEQSEHGDPLPARCQRGVTLQNTDPKSLAQLKEMITQETGIPVEIDPRVYNDPEDKNSPQAAAAAAQAAAQAPGGNSSFPFLGRPVVVNAAPPPAPAAAVITPNFHGSCEDVFDQIAANFDVNWRMNGHTLSFDKYVMRTITFRVSDAATKMQASLTSGGNQAGAGSGGGQGQGQGQTTQTASFEVTNDVWKEIEDGLKTLLPKGSRYTLSKTAGTATIICPLRVARDVQQWAEQLNAVLGATIELEFSAFYITVNDVDNYGLDVSALYQAGTQGGITAGLTGLLPSLATAGGTGSIGILKPTDGANNFNTHFAGSAILLNAVTTSQHNADFRSATQVGRNGVPMPINLSTDQDIVRSLTNAVGLTYGTTSVTAQTSTINYGFSLTAIPRIISPGVVNVFLSFSANDLTNLQDFQIGTTGTVELATIDNRTIWTEMPLRSGESLILAGTEQQKVQRTNQGVGSDSIPSPLGMQRAGTVTRTRLIILVTPTIIATPK